MKTATFVRVVALAACAIAPFAAHSSDNDVMQSCVKAFTAENFAGQPTQVTTQRRSLRLPLSLNSRPVVKLSAASADSGLDLATAVCTKKNDTVTVALADDAH